MKRVIFLAVALLLIFSVVPVSAGNDAPNGPHYNLNLIGVENPKTADMTNNDGHRIFVPLNGNTKILLAPGDFNVLDANGTDSDGAKFQLPVPADADSCPPDAATCEVRYQVFIRVLGTPGGNIRMGTCYDDPATVEDDRYCSDPDWWVDLTREAGKPPKFTNVSRELLYISYYSDIDADGTLEFVHEPLFAQGDEGYFWDYYGTGMRLAQLRFYEIPGSVTWTK